MRIINKTKGVVLAERGECACSFLRRLKGLLFTAALPAGGGLLIRPCNSIHTIGMSYDIDVLFVNSRNIIAKAVSVVGPWRLVTCFGSAYVVELPAGTLAATGTGAGDKLELI